MSPSKCGCLAPDEHWGKHIPLVQVEAHTVIQATTSRTTLNQTFQNPFRNKPLEELKYVFPLFDGIAVVAFTCIIGDRMIRGVIKESNDAKKTYDEAKAAGKRTALFAQSLQASDIFSTNIGNVPPAENIKVQLEYIGELKHDAEVDAIRFTIPTCIAPRYGDDDDRYGVFRASNPANIDAYGGFSVTVDVEMPLGTSIKSVQSPSHPISVEIGTSSNNKSDEPTPEKASASLSLGAAELEKDFVLQVSATQLGEPSAIFETHPSIPTQKALMATLVPKFNLTPEKPEVVFVCDKSGSMRGTKLKNLQGALHVFLKSLPVGIMFNICIFNSSHAFLWPRSKSYDQTTLSEAVDCANSLTAGGGTDIYKPLAETFDQRCKDMNLEVFLLTDGQIRNQDKTFNLVNQKVSESQGKVRVFTLGIGQSASHSLSEGIAKAGNGFSQQVGENEKMGKKVVRMLRASLMPHVKDYRMEIKYSDSENSEAMEDDFEIIEKVANASDGILEAAVEGPKPPISLYNVESQPETDMNMSDTSAELKYNNFPEIETPKYLQTPYNIPRLFPFSRTVVYVLLSDQSTDRMPKSVVLKGSCTQGPLELNIPVIPLAEKGQTIHQLAAREAVQNLEEGRGWIYHAKNRDSGKYLKDEFKGHFPDMVKREAVRLGLRYQITGKWCSFVAVDEIQGGAVEERAIEEQAIDTSSPVYVSPHPDMDEGLSLFGSGPASPTSPIHTGDVLNSCNEFDNVENHLDLVSQSVFQRLHSKDIGVGRDESIKGHSSDHSIAGKRASHLLAENSSHSNEMAAKKSRMKSVQSIKDSDNAEQACRLLEDDSPLLNIPIAQAKNRKLVQATKVQRRMDPRLPKPDETKDMDIVSVPKSVDESFEKLTLQQQFAGNWIWCTDVLCTLGLESSAVDQAARTQEVYDEAIKDVLTTACVLAFFEKRSNAEKEEWEMIIEKAIGWMHEQVEKEEANKLIEAMSSLF